MTIKLTHHVKVRSCLGRNESSDNEEVFGIRKLCFELQQCLQSMYFTMH